MPVCHPRSFFVVKLMTVNDYMGEIDWHEFIR